MDAAVRLANLAPGGVNQYSTAEAKIALFRSLFRGREDVYPRRFESRKTGRAGYSPVCGNEWVQGICEKPKIKCSECPHQRFLPVTDDAIRWHLKGQDDHGRNFVMGVYPMLVDETCFLLAADFDKAAWQDDAAAFLETCRLMSLPVALERSQSGKGGHVWFFFDEAIPTTLARKLGAYILTETMERRPDIGLDSYDRFFPNQDTLPQGGFGNLIALPLQKRRREFGNSVFLDARLTPLPDQWEFLSSIRRIKRSEVEDRVRIAEAKGQVIAIRLAPQDEEDETTPWMAPPSRRGKEAQIAGPLPKTLDLTLGNQIYIAKEAMPPALRNRLIRLAAFQNPEFYKAQAMRLSTYDKPRIIACAEDYPQHVGLPRGCLDDLLQTLSALNIKPVMHDQRNPGEPLNVTFQGELRPEQSGAAQAMLAQDMGVLAATTAFGKTVVAAWLIAQRGVNALVLVHRRQLQQQWVDRLSSFLGLPVRAIGQIGGGRKKPTGLLDVAVIQSLVRNGVVEDLVANYGHIIVDECHHLSAQSFELVARQAKAKSVTGLTATVARKDGHHPIIFMQCGPVRYRGNAKKQAAAHPFDHTVMVRPTDFRPVRPANPNVRQQFQELYAELITDEERNRLVHQDVIQALRDGRSPLVLTERNEHLDSLAKQLGPEVRHLVVLRGGMRKKVVVTDRDPVRARDMAAAYVEELNKLIVEMDTSAAHRERLFLEQRLRDVESDLEASEEQFGHYSSRTGTMDQNSQSKAMLDAFATVQGELIAAQSDLSGLQSLYAPESARVVQAKARVAALSGQLQKLEGARGGEADKGQEYPSLRQLPRRGVTYADLYRRTKTLEVAGNEKYHLEAS